MRRERFIQFLQQLHCEQGVTAKLEKIVGDANFSEAQNRLPNIDQKPLYLIARSDTVVRQGSARMAIIGKATSVRSSFLQLRLEKLRCEQLLLFHEGIKVARGHDYLGTSFGQALIECIQAFFDVHAKAPLLFFQLLAY